MDDFAEQQRVAVLARPWQLHKDRFGTSIHTAWIHPQLENYAPVVTLATTIEEGKNPQIVCIRDADAAFIVTACNEYDAMKERLAQLEALARDSVADMHRHRKWVIGYPAYGDAAMSVRLGRITEIDNFLEQARALGIFAEKEVA